MNQNLSVSLVESALIFFFSARQYERVLISRDRHFTIVSFRTTLNVPSSTVSGQSAQEGVPIKLTAVLISPRHVIPRHWSVVCSDVLPSLCVIILVVLGHKIFSVAFFCDAIQLGWNPAGFWESNMLL